MGGQMPPLGRQRQTGGLVFIDLHSKFPACQSYRVRPRLKKKKSHFNSHILFSSKNYFEMCFSFWKPGLAWSLVRTTSAVSVGVVPQDGRASLQTPSW